jgi:hypothetical protein
MAKGKVGEGQMRNVNLYRLLFCGPRWLPEPELAPAPAPVEESPPKIAGIKAPLWIAETCSDSSNRQEKRSVLLSPDLSFRLVGLTCPLRVFFFVCFGLLTWVVASTKPRFTLSNAIRPNLTNPTKAQGHSMIIKV